MERFHQSDVSTVMRRCVFVAVIAIPASLVLAQVAGSQVPTRNLTQYEGHYECRDGLTLFMAAKQVD